MRAAPPTGWRGNNCQSGQKDNGMGNTANPTVHVSGLQEKQAEGPNAQVMGDKAVATGQLFNIPIFEDESCEKRIEAEILKRGSPRNQLQTEEEGGLKVMDDITPNGHDFDSVATASAVPPHGPLLSQWVGPTKTLAIAAAGPKQKLKSKKSIPSPVPEVEISAISTKPLRKRTAPSTEHDDKRVAKKVSLCLPVGLLEEGDQFGSAKAARQPCRDQ